MKSVYKAVAVAFVFALMLVPAVAITCGEASDATTVTINDTPQVTSSFSDNNAGTVKVIVNNKDTVAQTVTVKILYYTDYIDKIGSPLSDKTVEVAAGSSAEVYLTFSFTSRGDKDLTAVAYDSSGTELDHNNFSLNVSHSIWKDPVTYIVIVLVALVIIIIIALKIRSSGVGKKGKKADPNAPTFTQMEEEKQAKKVERKSKKR